MTDAANASTQTQLPPYPKTLMDAIRYFGDPQICVRYVSILRWPNGIECPHCESKTPPIYVSTRRIYKCRDCKKQFSPKAGTIFEDSAIRLDKWLTAMWMIANCKNGVSSMEVHRALNVTQKTAWFMLQRLRLAMQDEHSGLLGGIVEADETFIGGKARNMHKHVREAKIKGRGPSGKTIVVGLLERGGRVRTMVGDDKARRKKPLHNVIKDHVTPGSEVHTDALKSYEGLETEYAHKVIDHAVEYVNGHVHTNGMENFWSLLKRSLKGTYVSVEPYHLFRYLDEQAFRFNERHADDQGRFLKVLSHVKGRRLTYKQVTGKAAKTN